MLAGASGLQKLDLSTVTLDTVEAVASLEEAITQEGLPALEELYLQNCSLTAAAAATLGRLLKRCPRLHTLVLERNLGLLSTPEAAAQLGDALGSQGLPQLRLLSLRWCQLPAAVGGSLVSMLKKCPRLEEVDLLGSRRLVKAELEAVRSSAPNVRFRGLEITS